MKTGVFKKASYFAAAFALAASSSIFVPGMVYADEPEPDGYGVAYPAIVNDETGYETLAQAVEGARAAGIKDINVKITADQESIGFKTFAGETLTVDLGGHNITMTKPTVGSTGTETNAMQLLKGSTVTFSGGTVTAGPDAKIFFQNYSDLTLNNVTLDTRGNSYGGLYAVSNNYGNVNIVGNTSILTNSSANHVAFDVWDNMSDDYSGGAHVVIDTTGTIDGKVEVGQSRVRADDAGLSTLEIKNGTFTGAIVSSSGAGKNDMLDQVTVSGGTFNVELSDKTKVVEGKAIYKAGGDGPWVVDTKVTDAEIDAMKQRITVKAGGTATLNLTDVAKKYATVDLVAAAPEPETGGVDPANVATLNELTITGVAAGYTEVQVILHDEGDEGRMSRVPVYVYEENNDAAEFHTEVDPEGTTDVALAQEFGEDVFNALKNAIGGDNIAGYFDVRVKVVDQNDTEMWTVPETDSMMEIRVAMPAGVPAVTDGYTRTWYFVYSHNGGEPKRIEAVDNGDGTLSAWSKEFSPYILAYVDTAVTNNETVTSASAKAASAAVNTTNPNTGDSVATYVAVAWLSIAAMVGAISCLVRREA